MDNPQHYQPLSHALNPPHTASASQSHFSTYDPPTTSNGVPIGARPEEEEEEDDDDEGIVEEQLNDNDHEHETHHVGSSDASSKAKPNRSGGKLHAKKVVGSDADHPSEGGKRRPGRPRGSKNRKPRVTGESTIKPQPATSFYPYSHPPLHPTGTGTAPPALPEVNAQNQQYYEFQWRVLNLCAEFYGAAEELFKSTPPLVISQCYAMGSSKVDPIVMLNDAKRNCDQLLANPSRLIATPPPPLYPVIPSFHPPAATVTPSPKPAAATATSATPSTSSKTNNQAPIITNPQSFVVSLGGQNQPASTVSYPNVYHPPPPPPQYPTAPYYHQFSPYPGYYTTTTTSTGTPSTASGVPQQASTSTTIPANINQGAWSDEETERLKRLTEESKVNNPSGDVDWEWVVTRWGNGRTRHQILLKATSLGLKSSTSRTLKRRRDGDGVRGDSESEMAHQQAPPPPPSQQQQQQQHLPQPPQSGGLTAGGSNASVGPSSAHDNVRLRASASPAGSTPQASPALSHQQRPSSSATNATTGGGGTTSNTTPSPTKPTTLPWPMPTVAANTPSPVIATATPTPGVVDQRTSYYRPRPSQGAIDLPKPPSRAGQFVFHTTNGTARKASGP